MWRRKSYNRTVKNGGTHCTAHHSVREDCLDAIDAVRGIGIAEILLKSLPVHTVVCLKESQVGEESSSRQHLRHKVGRDLLFKAVEKWSTCQTPPINTLEILTSQAGPSRVILDILGLVKHSQIPINQMQWA